MTPRAQATSERARFERFCRSLSDDELMRPVPSSGWVVKDFISHLATIDGPVAAWFRSIQGGTPSYGGARGAAWDVDRYNDDAVAARRDLTVEQILDEASRERAAMIAVIDRFTDDQLDGSVRFGGDSKRPPVDLQVYRYLQGWARHDAIHTADLLRALPERRADAAIIEWFAEPAVAAIVGQYQRAMG
jgi:uncharacterized damage-inducible protein DinB